MYHAPVNAPLVVGLGRIGVSISGLGPNLPSPDAPTSDLAAFATTPAPGIAALTPGRAPERIDLQTRSLPTAWPGFR